MSQETNDTALGGAFGGEGEGLVQTNPEVEASQDPTITKIVTEDNSLGGTFGSDESPLAQSLSGEAATAAGEAQASEEAAQISATNAANSASAAATSATNASTSETNAATSATDASLSETNAVTSAYTATTKANEASTSATNASTSATNAATSATNAATSETNAATSATNASNSDASSLLNAQEAQSSASQASTSASNAAGSATLAGTHKDAAEDAQGASETARDQAQTYATNSQTSATQSEASATAAATSASEASDSETNAATSETNASTSATNASNSATASANSATQAANSVTQAATSATNAATSATNAFTSETNAATSATNSSDSATASATSASEASTSASNALTSEGNASDSATASATSATNAATSATNASTSEGNAATSATNAATSETNAATSATNAATSATNAATSATESSDSAGDSSVSATQSATSATNAATSATNAATSETNAATSESNAAASASEASVSEGNAEASANNASTSATNAANSATAASNSASAAATSASNAASSASAASSSAANASVSETNAANLLDQFEDIYLGSKTSDPTLDNDGDTLQVGSLYFNSTTNDLKIWTGSVWTQVLVDAELQTIVDDAIADLIDSAPTALNTLNELAAALGDDPNFSATISNQIGTLQNDVATLGNIKYEEGDDISVSSVTLEGAATGVGLISWDATNETASMTMGNGVTQQIGEELYYPKRTRNMTGFTIPNGTPVMLVGGVGEDSYIAPAIADGSIPHEYYAGLTTEAIADGDYGRVLFFGSINDIDTSSYTKGDLLYVSDTTHGAFTTTPPEAPSHAILSAIVTKVGTTDGRLFVRVHTNPEAGEITFDNATSGLVSSSVQGAIDELQSNKASVDLLSSNITLFPTTATSPDVTNHNRLVTSKADSDYDTTAQNVATGTVTTSETLVGQLTSDAGLVEGSIAGITVTLIGNIEKLTGNNNQGAHFYFKIYRRESDGTEYLMGESFHTPTLFETDGYEQFSASVYLSNSGMSNFADTDRFVLRFYGIAEGGDCSYQFQFGGEAPVRGIVPVPVSVIPSSSAEDTPTSTTNFNGILSGTNSNVQSALDTLDDHGHAISGITGLDSALQNKVDVTGYNNTNWDTAYGWGDHDGLYLPIDAVTLPDQTGHSGQFLTTNGTTADWATVDTSLGDTAYGWGDHSTEGYLTSFTETDPTVPSHVKSITTTNISNWNTAYGWGDHSTEGYLTSIPSEYLTQTEGDARYLSINATTLPDQTGHSGQFLTTNGTDADWATVDTSLGDTAYGWGDHASVGYLTSIPSSYLTTSTGVQQLGLTGSPNYTTPSSRRVDPNASNPTNEHYAVMTYGNDGNVTGQLATHFVSGATYNRAHNNSWSAWSRMFDDEYHPNADKWTTARSHTVTLTGQVTGSATQSVDGTGNKTWSIATTLNDSALDDQYVTVGSRHTGNASGLLQPNKASIRIWDVSTASDDPSGAADGLVLSAGWDSSSWGVQQYHDFHTNDLYLRSKQNGTFSSWERVWSDGNDGSGSGLDADLLDGQHGSYYTSTYTAAHVGLDTSGSSSYPRMFARNNPTGSGDWLRMPTTGGGLLPYSNGNSYVGTSSWRFSQGWFNSLNGGTPWTSSNDGSGSGLDADLLDGLHASSFWQNSGSWRGTHTDKTRVYGVSYGGGEVWLGYASGKGHVIADGEFYANEGRYVAWNAGNDGSGSGLDADLLDGQHASAFASASHSHTPESIGAAKFVNNAYLNSSTTTATFITELTNEFGCFNNSQVTLKCAWSYAGNSNLATGHPTIGTIELAGCTIETWGGTYKHVRITRPNTGTGGHGVYEYNDQSSSYAPGWREIWTSESDGSGSGLDADLLDGQHASAFALASHSHSYLPLSGGNMTGRIYMASSAGHPGNAAPTALSYGKLTGYGTFYINADTDGSTTEYLYLTAGYGQGAGASNEGLRIGYAANSLTWKGNAVWNSGNDGSGSGLDADLLDGLQASAFINTSSKNASGWHKCATTGVIIQWARIYVTANSTTYWTFPTAFPSACRSISANQESSNAGIGDNSQFYSISRTGATLRNGWNSSATYFTVFAIGY